MRKITMLKQTPGSPDGVNVIVYKEGETYDVPDNLAKAFVDAMKVADYVVAGRRAQPAEAKMGSGAPENKDGSAVLTDGDENAIVDVPRKSPVRGASPRQG